MAFVREHWRPLTGAAGLHIGLLALLAFAAWQWPRSQPPVQLAIEGVVVDAQQRPAPGIRVWLRDWDFGTGGQKSGSVVEVLTDRQGRYRFASVPPGGAWLQLLVAVDERSPMTRAVEPFEVEAGKTYTHDLQVPAK